MTPPYSAKEQQSSLFSDFSQKRELKTLPNTFVRSSFQIIAAVISISSLGGLFLGFFYSLFTSLSKGLLFGLIHGLFAGVIWIFIWYRNSHY